MLVLVLGLVLVLVLVLVLLLVLVLVAVLSALPWPQLGSSTRRCCKGSAVGSSGGLLTTNSRRSCGG